MNNGGIDGEALDRLKVPSTLWRALALLGLDTVRILQLAHLPASLPQQSDTPITTDRLFAIFTAIEGVLPSPSLSLQLSHAMKKAAHTPAFLAATYTANFRAAISLLTETNRLGTCEKIDISDRGGYSIITRHWPFASGPEPRSFAEAWVIFLLGLCRRGTEEWITPAKVEFAHPGSVDEEFRAFLDCPIRYGAATNRVVMRAADLDRPFVTRNDEVLAFLIPPLRDAHKIFEEQSLADRVKAVLKSRLAGNRPELTEIAHHLAMSERTLQRRIEDENLTFRGLLAETRRELGRNLVANPTVAMSEVAYLLGYQETSSFYRAFRDWEGMTPRQWRERVVGHSLIL